MGSLTGLQRDGDRLTLVSGSDTMLVQVCRSDVLKVDFRPSGQVSPPTLMINPTNWPAVGASIDTNSDPIVIVTDAMRVEIARSPCRISVYDATGTNLLLRERAGEGVFADGARFEHRAGSEFYGLYAYDAWDNTSAGLLRSGGGWVEAGSQGNAGAPIAWTRHGFGVLVDSDGAQFNINSTNLTFEFISRANIEYYVLVGQPDAIWSGTMAVSGLPPMFPKYAMGFANTEWGINQTEFTNHVNTYRSKEIPIDQFVLDFDWKAWGEDNYGEWRWGAAKFPLGPTGELYTRMQQQGMHMAGIMKPRIFVNTVQGQYATVNGYWWPGSSPYSDYFSGGTVNDLNFAIAGCRDWYWDHSTNSFATGIRGWWNDEADLRGGGGGYFDNWQHLNMQRSLYDGQRGYSTQRVWSINRNFYLGAQRYAYALWSGDISTGFGSMAGQRERMLAAINVGQAWWGMDIGGFNSGDPSPENYARWMQFGAFVPVYRVHGFENTQRQPWFYGATAEAAAKAAVQLRYTLIPYIYSHARRHAETGIGLVKPLVQAFPADPAAANYKEAWMFGDALLASPVVVQGQSSKNIYLPAGTWFDYTRGTRYSGGQTIAYPLDTVTWKDIPLFVRQGAIIPTQPVMNYVTERPVTNITVDVFPATNTTTFTYYDDDGISYAYESGEYFKQTFAAQDLGEARTLDIGAASGTFTPALQTYLCRIYSPSASAVVVNGAPATYYPSLAALSAAPGEGWTQTTNQFGSYTAVKVAAGAARSIVVSNNAVVAPAITPPGGAISGTVTVSITSATSGAEIRYTTNGDEPDEFDALYTGPLSIGASVTLKARGFKTGRTASETVTAVFTRDNNLLNNGHFELGGSTTNKALYWTAGEPDTHGHTWGTGTRVNWRSVSGSWIGAIRGTWSGEGSTGGLWQEAPAQAGRSYRFSAQLWADNNWSTGEQGLKIEFFDGGSDPQNLLLAVTNRFTGIGQSWTERSVQATAPSGATWVRAVIYANGVGGNGALQFDDLTLNTTNQQALTVLSDYGQPVPAVGVHAFDRGSTITNSVNAAVTNGTIEYQCTGWSLTGHSPSSGAGPVMTMTITNDATLRWLWTTNFLEPVDLAFGVAALSVAEAAGSVSIPVVRTGGTQGQVRVSYRTVDGTAQAGLDFVAVTGELVFADGVTSNNIAIALPDDLQFESDKTFAVVLEQPAYATLIAPTQAVITILNDDADLGTRELAIVSAHGAPTPPVGVTSMPHGVWTMASAPALVSGASTQYLNAGWTATGSAPAGGATNQTPSFLLTADTTLTWLWNTQVVFARAAATNGSVAGSPAGWYNLGSSVTVTATPSATYQFAGWTGDVTPAQAMQNPLALALDRARSITATFSPMSGTNLLRNPSFELVGNITTNALYWTPNDPDLNGDRWGTAVRVNWRSNSGAWQGAIRGLWANAGSSGGMWQEVPAMPGRAYRLTGWFWADNTWGAGEQSFKLEFLSGTGGGQTLLAATTSSLSGVSQSWVQRTLTGVAPSNAAWVRVVVLANSIGSDGALQFDDLNLELAPYLDAPAIAGVEALTSAGGELVWYGVAQATGYCVDVATNAGFGAGSFVPGYAARAAGATNSLSITGLVGGATYHFRVMATNAFTNSAYSGVFTAATPAVYGLLARAGANGDVSPSGLVSVGAGASTNFVVTAAPYYRIASIATNGGAVSVPEGATSWTVTWSQVSSTGLVDAAFAAIVTEGKQTPWWWLAQHGLTNGETDFAAAELADLDGDGHAAWAEYVADTDPNAATSVLSVAVSSVSPEGWNVVVWPGATNRYYDLFAGTNLNASLDQVLTNQIGVTPLNVYTDMVPRADAPVYYRVRARMAPE